MAPKHKSSSSMKDGRVEKKIHEITKQDSPSMKVGDDESKKQQEGKIVKSNFDDKESFCSSMKINLFSPHLLDENQNNIKGEFPILELN